MPWYRTDETTSMFLIVVRGVLFPFYHTHHILIVAKREEVERKHIYLITFVSFGCEIVVKISSCKRFCLYLPSVPVKDPQSSQKIKMYHS